MRTSARAAASRGGARFSRAVLALAIAMAVGGCGGADSNGTTAVVPETADDGPGDAGTTTDRELVLRFRTYYREALGDLSAALPGETRFTRSPALSRESCLRFAKEYRPLDPAASADIADLVASGKALDALNEQIGTYGMDPEDVADVMAFHFALHWAIANRSLIDAAQLTEIRRTLLPAVLEEVVAVGGDDDAMQRLADRYALFAAVHSHGYAELLRKQDEQAARRYSDEVHRDFLARTGVDLRRATLSTSE